MRLDGKETKAIVHLMANDVSEVMSTSSSNPNPFTHDAELSSQQGASGDRIFECGSHLPIHPRIMLSCAVLSTRVPQTGSSEAVFSKSGSLLALCSGLTASVRHSTFPVPLSDVSCIAGSGKSVLWCALSHVISSHVT